MATGELRRTGQVIDVEWEVPDFLTSDGEVDSSHDGPEFSFSESLWYLRVRPNGEKKCDSEGWIGLYVMKKKVGPDRRMKYKLGIKNNKGTLENFQSSTEVFGGKDNGWGYAKYMERSKLTARRLDFVRSGMLTFRCTLINEESRRVEAPLFSRLLNVSRNLKEVLDSGNQSDVILKVGEREMKAHRAILEARSSVFKAMFSHEMVEFKTGEVTISDMDPDILQQVLSYVYCGDVVSLDDDNVCQVYAAADKYDLKELRVLCANYMEENMSEKIVCDVVAIADLYKEARLKDVSKQFFIANSVQILKSESWERLAKENHATAIQLLTSVVLENTRDKK